MNYYDALRRTGKLLDAKFEQSKDILHSASKGTIRELIIKEIIQPFLPSCYGLSGGESFDKNGKMSKQLDLIVYDKIFSFAVPYLDNYIQFPCESVYGNIEIKSKLNKDEFESAIENIASLKILERADATSWTVTPLSKISVNGKPTDKSNFYFGIIFAYDSVEVETVLGYIKSMEMNPMLLPNAIVLYSKNTILLPMTKDTVYTIPNIEDFIGYEAIYCEDDTIALFIGLLINYLKQTKLLAADIPKETNNIFSELLNKQYPKIDRKTNCAILKNKLE